MPQDQKSTKEEGVLENDGRHLTHCRSTVKKPPTQCSGEEREKNHAIEVSQHRKKEMDAEREAYADGWRGPLSGSAMHEALAQATSGKGGGDDTVHTDMWKSLPIQLPLHLMNMMKEYIRTE